MEQASDPSRRPNPASSLEDELQRTRLAAQAARMTIWEIDVASQRMTVAPVSLDWLGYGQPKSVSALLAHVHTADRHRLEVALRRSLGGVEPLDHEYRLVMADTSPLWVRSRAVLQDGRLVGVTQDISDMKLAQDQQRRAVAGLQHQMKNALAVVRSISARSLETADSLDAFAIHFGGRLDSMARIQNVLARTPQGVELEDLIHDELGADLAREADQVDVGGPRILLKNRAVEVLAMAFHELTTNAVKFGALSRPEGRISVGWRMNDSTRNRKLLLWWNERGVAALNPWPARIGFGRDLLERGLAYELSAVTTLAFAPGGVQCNIELPFSDRIVALDPYAEEADDGLEQSR